MTEHLPVFVYGTLCSGLHNYEKYLKGRTEKEVPAVTAGKLHAAAHNQYPCLLKEGELPIAGELMYVHSSRYKDVMAQLDQLEGYNEHDKENSDYVRERIEVATSEGDWVTAYIYYWNQPDDLGVWIKEGSWRKYIAADV
ncbi:gamma-glutamylcyclotransferase family protein [Sinobaca sp. H24]|uniref:gamma-glutamylcyclotransferase family protein n=1 Tax=Sinobaca sp. H24 TaxID=2923376 RepID=UPI00207A9FA6|nr:gamma-glutamylcyclotransferase family protein [Sinobaca sp. H24]